MSTLACPRLVRGCCPCKLADSHLDRCVCVHGAHRFTARLRVSRALIDLVQDRCLGRWG